MVIDCLRKSGAKIDVGNNKLRVTFRGALKPINVTTLPYPGFPTDMQAQFAESNVFNGRSKYYYRKDIP